MHPVIMVETVGQILQTARGERNLSLEDASRATKIRSRQLADLERDEYTNFPNLAYAKGFLLSYAKYLDVDVRPYLQGFADASTFGLDDYQYLSEVPLGVYRATRRPMRRKGRGKRSSLLAYTLAAVALIALGWRLYVNYERLGDLGQLAERQEAGARGGADIPDAPASAAPAPSAVDAEVVSARRYGPRPALPQPGDGGAIRQLLGDSAKTPAPFVFFGDIRSWSPETVEGYRFCVRNLDRYSVEIFRTGAPRPKTALNNSR